MIDDPWLLIAACALATYATRAGGHLILSQFGALNHRVEAALEAVPIAVLAALIAPYLVSRGMAESLALVFAGLVAIRFSMMTTTALGLIAVVVLRALIG